MAWLPLETRRGARSPENAGIVYRKCILRQLNSGHLLSWIGLCFLLRRCDIVKAHHLMSQCQHIDAHRTINVCGKKRSVQRFDRRFHMSRDAAENTFERATEITGVALNTDNWCVLRKC